MMQKQLSLFDIKETTSPEPLPLIVAKNWGFTLTYVDRDGNIDNYLYCANEWYIGLGGNKSNWHRGKSDWLSTAQPVMIEVKRERRKPETLEFVTEKGLYDIVQVMKVTKKNKDKLQPIKDYLSESGVEFDKERRSPAHAETKIKALEKHHQLRQDSIKERIQFAKVARDTHVSKSPQYGVLTNMVYFKIARTSQPHTAKKEIIAVLGLSDKQARHLRDHLNELVLSAITMAESAASMKMQDEGRLLTDSEQLAIVTQCARIAAVSAHELASYIGKDLLTGKPLLGSGE